jgi:hypothetical protein
VPTDAGLLIRSPRQPSALLPPLIMTEPQPTK